MLSIGIQFGEGFDEGTVIRMSQTIPKEYDYDLLVIGSNPGGVACAREARLAGKKTAIITWKSYSPAEEEGFDEDLHEMSVVLDQPIRQNSFTKRSSIVGDFRRKSSVVPKKSGSTGFSSSVRNSSSVSEKSSKKVRKSRLDLNNELFKRGKQCRKLMHNAVRLGELVEDAHKSGWRLTSTRPPLTINWHKMSEEIMDYVMEENYALAEELGNESVEVIEGSPKFEDDHTVKVFKNDSSESELSAEIICLALSAECIFPAEIPGARQYGISCDDFIRLNEPPGKTLIVGSILEGIECAGIIAGSRIPCTIVSRSKILKGYDSEISQMIMDDLRSKGVVFKEETTVTSVEETADKKLLAKFEVFSQDEESVTETDETFDTVLLAVGRKIMYPKSLNFSDIGIVVDPESTKIKVDSYGQTQVQHIYAVGDILADCPEDYEVSLLAGKLLGRRLFHEETELMNYCDIPTVMYTPTEYAFVGISESGAVNRLGTECVDVYSVYFKPLDYFAPSKTGECFAKVIVLKAKDSIIGLHVYGPEAGEIIQGFAAAIRNGLTMTNFRTIVGVTATKAQEILKVKGMRNEEQSVEE